MLGAPPPLDPSLEVYCKCKLKNHLCVLRDVPSQKDYTGDIVDSNIDKVYDHIWITDISAKVL